MRGEQTFRRLLAVGLANLCLHAQAQTDEQDFGVAAAARILGAAPLVESAQAQRYVNLVGATLALRSASGVAWRFGLVRTDAINAFAAPGGFVLLTEGLARSLHSEDELAFVIAHEMAHVLRRHHYKVVQRQQLADKAAKGLQAVGASVDAGLSHASAQVYARGLDKGSEFDADRIGIELMASAGYDPAAALAVLERLQSLKGDDSRAALLFSTHPSPMDRMDALLQSGIDSLTRPGEASMSARDSRFRQFLASF